MRAFFETIKEILVSVLVEQWYYGLALAIILWLVFAFVLEDIAKKHGKKPAIVVGIVGIALYSALAVLLIKSHTFFAIALLALAAAFVYFAYFAYFGKKDDKKKGPKK